MIRRAVEKELLRQTFQLFPSTTMLVTESLNASDRCQGQPPLKCDVIDLVKRHYLSVATVQSTESRSLSMHLQFFRCIHSNLFSSDKGSYYFDRK